MEQIIDKDTIIYKGIRDTNVSWDSKYNKPVWFSLDEDIASNYGNIHQFKVKRPLRLINIGSLEFHTKWLDMINLMGNENMRNRLLIPLGLPDMDTTIKMVKNLKNSDGKSLIVKNIVEDENFNMVKDIAAFYNYHYRTTFFGLDLGLATAMKALFSNYDGYASFVNLPCLYPHPGILPTELCIFDIKDILIEEQYNGGGKTKKHSNKMKGGAPMIVRNNYPEEETNDKIEKELKTLQSKLKKMKL